MSLAPSRANENADSCAATQEVWMTTRLANLGFDANDPVRLARFWAGDRKSTRLNSSHSQISYAVFCLKKKTTRQAYRMVDEKIPGSHVPNDWRTLSRPRHARGFLGDHVSYGPSTVLDPQSSRGLVQRS